jgi:hypothetical protein
MASMRRVTRKPPKMLMAAMKMPSAASRVIRTRGRSDLHQRAQNDDRRDRVGDRHQRRVQRVRDVPDHLEADEDRQHEHDEMLHEACRRDHPDAQHQRGADGKQRDLPFLVCALNAATSCARFPRASVPWAFPFGAAAMAATLGGGGGKVISPAWATVAPRITSSSMLWTICPSLLGRQVGHHVADVVGVKRRGLRRPCGWGNRCSR